jgi:hypothetical protein
MAIAFQVDAQATGFLYSMRWQYGERERLPRQYLQLLPMLISQLLQRLAGRLAADEEGAEQQRGESSKKTGPQRWAGKVVAHQKS